MKAASENSLLIKPLLFAVVALFTHAALSATNSGSFTAAPPFVATNVGKPNVVIALDISGSMKAVAYRDVSAGGWSNSDTLHDDFDPARSYFGYFNSASSYRYDAAASKRFFVEDNAAGTWNGNFLNWLTMRRMDVARKVLVGGKVRDRDGEVIDGDTWYVVEGQNEPEDRSFRKASAVGSTVSPFPNNTEFLISEGALTINNTSNAKTLVLSDTVEMGQVSINRNTSADGDLNSSSNWLTVNLQNTYVNPVVVSTGLGYNGSDPTHTRVRNVTATSFQVRLEEWDYRDINHTTEEVSYIVAEGGLGGSNTIEVKPDATSPAVSYQVRAGTINTSATSTTAMSGVTQALASTYTPIVFAGVSSQNNDRPVIARLFNVGTTGFEVSLQNEEAFYSSAPHPANEDIHWIAFEPVSGIVVHNDFEAGIDVGDSGGDNVTHSWSSVSFAGGGTRIQEQPILAMRAQTSNGQNTAVARYRNLTENGFQVFMEEEKSLDSEIDHIDERVGYLAVEAVSGYNIRIGELEEPVGIIQQNSGSMRFGVAVYNYDHTKDPTSIYNGNKVHGGTFRPCYPDISLPVSDRTNFDICLDTHVKSPLSNVLDVIEDHPLIWGTTPIAETLYDIKGYFEQRDHSRRGAYFDSGDYVVTGHTQWYDNGTEASSGLAPDGNPKARNSYEVSNAWDPFYYDEFSAKQPCAKSFVLHFNDGAPYTDYDGDASEHPTITDDGNGAFGENEVLDDLALMLRQNDCRTDTGMAGHQEIISYYIYAALGEDEAFNGSTRKMREAAANGGFLDADEDRTPDPNDRPGGGNINDFVQDADCDPESNGWDVNEWDANEDCNPDTFYFANDGEALVTQLNSAFLDIVSRAATGGASSVIAASRSGEGNVVNAIFRPFMASGADEVTWIGDVHALMIDSAGNLRQDDGDKILESAESDPYVDMCSDSDENLVRVKLSNVEAARPTTEQFSACSQSVFTLDLFDVEYLWSGLDWLSSLTDAQVAAQRTYTSNGSGRYIITGIDADGNGIIQNAEQTDFLAASFPSEVAGLIAPDINVAQDIITFIRGQDVSGYRSRQLNGETMRLGDVVYSTPTIVGRPAENLDFLYQSTSYRAFFERYRNRRQVIYAGGNDGMLHAFNGGWFDAETKEFKGAHGSEPGSTRNYDLGAELWAYVPYNALPHLEYLARPSYGATSADHLSFVDLKPRIFDAKIFADDTDHPGGWGTVLVVGMRLGGGETTVDADLGAPLDRRTLSSSYAIFDITNPDNAPELLLEFTHPDLGFATSIPAPVTVGTDNEGNGDWYLMIGSGADRDAAGFDTVVSTQNPRLFLLDLKDVAAGNTTVLESNFGTNGVYTLSESNAFVSDLVAVDFGLDNFTTDAVYFGTVSGSASSWGGNLYRVKIQDSTNATPDAVNTWSPQVMVSAGSPITAPVSVAKDSSQNRWVYFGTGRYFTGIDNTDSSVHYYYGVKEPRDVDGTFNYNAVDLTSIADVTDTRVVTGTGVLDPAPSLTPPLTSGATVGTLERRMRQYSNTSELISGWKKDMLPGERNFGSATLLGGTLTYTTFDPVFDECSIEGDSYLYALNSLTGTASAQAILPQADDATHNADQLYIGGSPATSPSLHGGEGYSTDNRTTAIIQTADGNIITVDQDNEDKVRDGEASWRQLR